MEEEQKLILNFGEEQLELTPDNASLFSHIGELAMFDHVFVETSEDTGLYIFGHVESFTVIAQHLVNNKYPIHMNIQEVADCDRAAFIRSVDDTQIDVPDFIPEDWQN